MPQENGQAVRHQVGSEQPTDPTNRPQKLLLAEMFARLHRRNPGALPETTKATLLAAWREGRVPLIASKVREYRPYCSTRPHVWVPEPDPGDEKAEKYIAELGKTQIVGILPSTAPTTGVEEALSADQGIPPDIPPTDIRFNWATNKALWNDKTTAVMEFFDVGAMRDAFDQAWPPDVQNSHESTIDEALPRTKRRGPKGFDTWQLFQARFYLSLYNDDVPPHSDINIEQRADDLMEWGQNHPDIGTYAASCTPTPIYPTASIRWR